MLGVNENMNKYVRNAIFALATALFIFLLPIGEKEASAADFTASEFKTVATKYIGVPYVYGGTSTSGFDCSGYTRYVMSQLGISLPRSSSSMYQVGESVSKNELLPGDLLFFNTSGRGVSHVGIYLGGGEFIHSQTGKGVSRSKLNDPYYWGNKYVGAKRVASVE